MKKIVNLDYCEDSNELSTIKGYDFNKKFDFKEFLKTYETTGFQATNVAKAIKIIKTMQKDNARIFLAYNSNMITSGLRDIIAWLVKNKYVHVLVTTAGGVEEDVIKTLKPFLLGSFEADGAILREKGINRTGNIYIPDNRYVEFEKFLLLFLEELYQRQKNKQHSG